MLELDTFHKIAFVRFKKDDVRVGHNVANNNLFKTYELLFERKKREVFYVLNEFQDPGASLKKLKSFNPDLIIMLDERIDLSNFFRILKLYEMNLSLVKFIIHTYGDFLTRIAEWKKISEYAPKLNLNVCTSSETQKRIAKLMLKEGTEISVIPYSIEKNLVNKEELQKNDFGFKDDSIIFAFAGRISFQKNILGILKVMKLVNERDPRFKLVIFGNYDYKEVGLEGSIYPEGAINVYLSHFINEIDPYSKFIKFIPKKKRSSLLTLYHNVDAFISLSLMHLESYRIAPLEALSSGLPVFLSRWGGHRDISKYSSNVIYADIIKESGKLIFDEEKLASRILEFDFKNFDKEKASREFSESLNHEVIKDEIHKTITFSSFEGVSSMGLKAIFDSPTKYIFSTNKNHTIYFGDYWNDHT